MVDPAIASNPLIKRQVDIASPTAPTCIPFVIAKRYHNLRYIGSGSFGVVVSAKDALSSPAPTVAIKRCHSAFASSTSARQVLREVRLLLSLDHPNILQLYSIDLPPSYSAWNDVYLVTPLLRSGSLYSALKRHTGSALPEAVIKNVLAGLARALHYMQSSGVAHRDLKTANILIGPDWTPVLCDLGLARVVDEVSDMTARVVTRSYRAPELFITPGEYSGKVDMWSVGCILAEMLTPGQVLFGRRPGSTELQVIFDIIGTPSEAEMKVAFPNSSKRSYLRWQIAGRERRKVPFAEKFAHVGVEDERVFGLLERLLTLNPSDRMSPKELLENTYLASVRDVERETVVERERRWNISEMEPPMHCSKEHCKRAMWDEMANFHSSVAADMQTQGFGPPQKVVQGRKRHRSLEHIRPGRGRAAKAEDGNARKTRSHHNGHPRIEVKSWKGRIFGKRKTSVSGEPEKV